MVVARMRPLVTETVSEGALCSEGRTRSND